MRTTTWAATIAYVAYTVMINELGSLRVQMPVWEGILIGIVELLLAIAAVAGWTARIRRGHW